MLSTMPDSSAPNHSTSIVAAVRAPPLASATRRPPPSTPPPPTPRPQRGPPRGAPAAGAGPPPADALQQAGLLHSPHHYEQSYEEEYRLPVHLSQRRLGMPPPHDHQHRGPQHSPRGRLVVGSAGDDEPGDRERKNGQGHAQQGDVGENLTFVQGHDPLAHLGRRPEVVAEEEVEPAQEQGQDEENDRGQVDQEVGEAQVSGAADEDVGRVADERGRAADVGGHDLRNEERHGVQLHPPRHEQSEGRHKNHRRNVVQGGGGHRRYQRKEEKDRRCVPPRQLGGADGKPLERSRLTGDAGYYHHPHQQEDDVEVDCGERVLLIDDSEQNHSDAAGEGGGRPVYTLGDDHQVGEPEDQACYRQFVQPVDPSLAPS